MDKRIRRLNLFISYSHKDMRYKEKLLVSLTALQQSYNINTWHDGMIDAGGNIDENVKRALEQSQIVLLLMTDNYLASYYCMKVELKGALEREKRGKCLVIPVMFQETVLSDVLLFFKHNRVPQDGKAIATGFRNQSQGCTRAVNMIKDMIDKNCPNCKKKNDTPINAKTKKTVSKKNTSPRPNSSSVCIELYRNGKPEQIPVSQECINLIPKLHSSIEEFSTMMNQSLLNAKKRNLQLYKNFKNTTGAPESEKLKQLRYYLMDICAYTRTYITDPTGIKVHFRIAKEKKYLGLIASTDDNDAIDLASDWTTKMTPIPIYKGLIYHSSQLNAPLIKSLNKKLNYECKNDDIWQDYITFTFPNLHIGQTPLLSFCISIHKDYYRNKASMLKILAYLEFGKVIERYIISYCEICKKMDKNFNLNTIIKSL